MTRHAAALLLAAGTLLVVLLGAAQAAGASGRHPDPDPRPDPDVETETYLTLVKKHVLDLEQEIVTLTCEPESSTHPHPRAACRALARVDGDILELNLDPYAECPHVEDMMVVQAVGTWRGQPVRWQVRHFGNECELDAATGPVFRF